MLFVVDMEGRTDGRALKTILPQINPRKLVRFSLATSRSCTDTNTLRRSSSTANQTLWPTSQPPAELYLP